MDNTLTYPRTTTFTITHEYTGPYLGVTLYFTVKSVPYDADNTDVTDAIMTPKTISMTGSTFPQTTVITINPADVADTVIPGNYYYDIKVLDTNSDVYLCTSGSFQLTASPTNRA
jgi:hypothetical protein